jgi:hypothetical protein
LSVNVGKKSELFQMPIAGCQLPVARGIIQYPVSTTHHPKIFNNTAKSNKIIPRVRDTRRDKKEFIVYRFIAG